MDDGEIKILDVVWRNDKEGEIGHLQGGWEESWV